MSNYLQKYHLKKVQPVKSRPKQNLYSDYLKLHQKVEKVGVVKQTVKRKIPPHRNYFQKQQERTPSTVHRTQQHIKIESNPLIQDYSIKARNDTPLRSKNMHRSHKSLNFKSAKNFSAGTKILNTIQDFLTKIMRNNQGCNCGDPCPWGSKFFKWVNVPPSILKEHYTNVKSKWEVLLKQPEQLSENSSTSNQQSRRTCQTIKIFEEHRKNLKQIMKDIDRTQSESITFQNVVFKQRQRNILMCYAIEDPKLGYIQGMNIILSGILYHVKDQIKSYAIFRNLIIQIRDIYLNDFKECYAHISKVKQYLNLHVHDLYQIFQQINFDLNIICLPWILSMLSSIVPLEFLHLIYEGFIREKWMFIYKVSLAIFIYHKDTLITLDQPGDILIILSPTNEDKNSYDWQDIIAFGTAITL